MIDPSVVPALISRFGSAPAPAAPAAPAAELSRLTPRETDVLRLVDRGFSNAEIAEELYLDETTVKTHLGRVLEKLALRDRARAIAYAYAYAYESGLITPGDETSR